MRAWLRNRWNALRSTFWFLPGAMTVGAGGLAVLTLTLDLRLTEGIDPWAYGGGPEGARVLVSTVAGAMLGVAGVTFSVMIVALTMAASQLGPRLLRRFLRDRSNQFVLGSFLGTFLYCLVALLAVRTDGTVPAFSVSVAMALAVLSVAVLIHFIHHVSASLQADHVVATVSRDLLAALARAVRDEGADTPGREEETAGDASSLDLDPDALDVRTAACGYVQAIDYAGLLDLAAERDLVLVLDVRSDDFVVQEARLARVAPRGPGGLEALSAEAREALARPPRFA